LFLLYKAFYLLYLGSGDNTGKTYKGRDFWDCMGKRKVVTLLSKLAPIARGMQEFGPAIVKMWDNGATAMDISLEYELPSFFEGDCSNPLKAAESAIRFSLKGMRGGDMIEGFSGLIVSSKYRPESEKRSSGNIINYNNSERGDVVMNDKLRGALDIALNRGDDRTIILSYLDRSLAGIAKGMKYSGEFSMKNSEASALVKSIIDKSDLITRDEYAVIVKENMRERGAVNLEDRGLIRWSPVEKFFAHDLYKNGKPSGRLGKYTHADVGKFVFGIFGRERPAGTVKNVVYKVGKSLS